MAAAAAANTSIENHSATDTHIHTDTLTVIFGRVLWLVIIKSYGSARRQPDVGARAESTGATVANRGTVPDI